jgi:hypothetical protein
VSWAENDRGQYHRSELESNATRRSRCILRAVRGEAGRNLAENLDPYISRSLGFVLLELVEIVAVIASENGPPTAPIINIILSEPSPRSSTLSRSL